MIVFDGVSKKYGRLVALDKVSFSVDKGEIIGLLGLNGAGKTTTMRLIAGSTTPSHGIIRVDGGIGYLPENNPLYADMLVVEYLKFIQDIKNKTDIDHFNDIINKTGLRDYLKKKIDTLSYGYRQRVGLAVSLLGNPEILLLDEPSRGLDPIEQEKFVLLMKDLKKDKTIFFSSHVLSEVEEIATRLLILHKGKLVFDGPTPSQSESLETLFKKYVS